MKLSFVGAMCFNVVVLTFTLTLIPYSSFAYKRSLEKSPSKHYVSPPQIPRTNETIYRVTFASQPSGALLTYLGGTQIGLAPVSIDYNYDPKFIQNGCYMVMGVKAHWVSGATGLSVNPIALCHGPTGKERTYNVTISRPAKAQGSQKDIQFAIEYERQRELQQQQFMNSVISGLIVQGFQDANQPYYDDTALQNLWQQYSQPKQNTKFKCESRVNLMGTRLTTDCKGR